MNPLWSLITSACGWLLGHPDRWLPALGVVIIVAANWTNVTGTWRGQWSSSVVTWTIWSALAWVGLLAQIQLGGLIGAVLLIPVTAISTAVAAGAWWVRHQIKRGWRLPPPVDELAWQRWINRLCGVGGAAAFVALLGSSTGLVLTSSRQALILTIVTDAIAALPTIVAAWRDPRGQPLPCYAGGAASALCTLAATPDWSFAQAGYAGYLCALCAFVSMEIVLGRARSRADDPKPASVVPTVDPWPLQTDALVSATSALPDAMRTGRPDTVWAPASVLAAALDHAVRRSAEDQYRVGHQDGWRACAATQARPAPAAPGHNGQQPVTTEAVWHQLR